jgi:hypothetical protein
VYLRLVRLLYVKIFLYKSSYFLSSLLTFFLFYLFYLSILFVLPPHSLSPSLPLTLSPSPHFLPPSPPPHLSSLPPAPPLPHLQEEDTASSSDVEAHGNLFSSASAMFAFIKSSIKRCTALSNGQVITTIATALCCVALCCVVLCCVVLCLSTQFFLPLIYTYFLL